MKKTNTKFSHRVIAIFFTLTFLQTLIPYNQLWANNNGPNAPEAASFEPVDATDMVNLLTGDFSYVLPLLNVPSPEGGYPLALSYHSGIAMDQEASWVGLGWSLNPGAINRSVNGYPDDYKGGRVKEFMFDRERQDESYALSVGYGAGAFSVGLGFSWGSNQSFGGQVSVGVGMQNPDGSSLGINASAGTNGASIGIGGTFANGLSLGANISSDGTVGGSVGFNNNGQGFSVGANTAGTFSTGFSSGIGNDNIGTLGFSISSAGVGINASVTNRTAKQGKDGKTSYSVDGGAGVGINFAMNSSVTMGDFTVSSSGYTIPIMIPTPVGIFNLSFGKNKVKYHLASGDIDLVYGPLYYHEFGSENSYKFMDNYEFTVEQGKFSTALSWEKLNAIFPSYDKYQVQAQGLSGSMHPRLLENGKIYGQNSDGFNERNVRMTHLANQGTSSFGYSQSSPHIRFQGKPFFYFDNEISSHLDVQKANFTESKTNTYILDQYQGGVEGLPKRRRKTANYIEYFTNKEILENEANVISNGYIKPSATGFNRSSAPSDGVGAFMVTAADGKTYHYSLPVYNHEIITRTFNLIANRPESDSYRQKSQLEPYATHWLLTAVTGPDYVDVNGNGSVDTQDYGYWVSFEYGKWTDNFIWKAPYGKDYFETNEEFASSVREKTWIRGRKDIYYLDMVKTRTHSAVFIKSERNDARSEGWNYKAVGNFASQGFEYKTRFNVPAQKSLKLSKIILLKNEDVQINKAFGPSQHGYVDIDFTLSGSGGVKRSYYALKDNVIDIQDNWESLTDKSLKEIDFITDYSLVNSSPNSTSGRLTLNEVNFKGKKGAQLVPPYKFGYINSPSYVFDIEDQDRFGYYKHNNSLWSLNEITTPQGGKIAMDYVTKKFTPVVTSRVQFRIGHAVDDNKHIASVQSLSQETFTIETKSDYGISVGTDGLEIEFEEEDCDGVQLSSSRYRGTGRVIQDLSTADKFKYVVKGTGTWTHDSYPTDCGDGQYTGDEYLGIVFFTQNEIEQGGIAVSELTVTDGIDEYITEYSYNNAQSKGYVTYLPEAPNLSSEVPYSSELPAPKVMYENVTVQSHGKNQTANSYTTYKFNVIKSKSESEIKFGDFYELTFTDKTIRNTAYTLGKDVVLRDINVKDNFAAIGQLLEVKTYNSKDQLLNSVQNIYYAPGETPDLKGVVKQSYQSYKDIRNKFASDKDKWVITSSSRTEYPNLLAATIQTFGGHTYRTDFGQLDDVLGSHLETTTTSSSGEKMMVKTIPAFRIPEYSGGVNNIGTYNMGSKVDNITNKNMLSQNAASLTKIQKTSGTWKVLDAEISTWSNQWKYRGYNGEINYPEDDQTAAEKIWRKHKTYVWDGDLDNDGTYLGYSGDFDNFKWGINEAQTNSKWIHTSSVDLYDRFSTPLEVSDINGNKVSTKMGDKDGKVLSNANAAYTEAFYSGAEYIHSKNTGYFDGEIRSTGRSLDKAHTGKYSVKTAANVQGFRTFMQSGQHRSGRYKVSVWVDKANYTKARINTGSGNVSFNGEIIPAGNWVLMNHYFDVLSSEGKAIFVTSTGTTYFDDFRLHPVESGMTSYVYNEWDELSHIIGSNNLAIQYEYDDVGRLKKTYSEVVDAPGIIGGFKLTDEINYNYSGENSTSTVSAPPPPPPVNLSLGIGNINVSSTTITAYVSGGSGDYEYRWAVSTTNNSNLPYGSWTSSNTRSLYTECGEFGRRYYGCIVRDKVTGQSVTRTGTHQRQNCSGGGGGPILEEINQQ